jgi:hypothetical protein
MHILMTFIAFGFAFGENKRQMALPATDLCMLTGKYKFCPAMVKGVNRSVKLPSL